MRTFNHFQGMMILCANLHLAPGDYPINKNTELYSPIYACFLFWYTLLPFLRKKLLRELLFCIDANLAELLFIDTIKN